MTIEINGDPSWLSGVVVALIFIGAVAVACFMGLVGAVISENRKKIKDGK